MFLKGHLSRHVERVQSRETSQEVSQNPGKTQPCWHQGGDWQSCTQCQNLDGGRSESHQDLNSDWTRSGKELKLRECLLDFGPEQARGWGPGKPQEVRNLLPQKMQREIPNRCFFFNILIIYS